MKLKKIVSFSLSLAILSSSLIGCGVSESELNAITEQYDSKIADYEAKLAALDASIAELKAASDKSAAEAEKEARDKNWVIVTDYFSGKSNTDVSDEIQKAINENPNRTIYFPDGKYRLDKPITTPADPKKSVDLQLSNYAVIYATPKWKNDEAMIRLGATDSANDIVARGSFYSLTGGIIDGSGKAKCIAIEGGRETAVRDTSIKNAVVGIHIKRGANNGSSDADIYNVNIVGCGGDASIGVLCEGWDNTFTNMRIANVHQGVVLNSSGNMLRNIHPLYYLGSTSYAKSIAFCDNAGNNWYDYCYSDQFATAFYIAGNLSNVYNNCFVWWYANAGGGQVAFKTGGKFNSLISNVKIGFYHDSKINHILKLGEKGGTGVIEYVLTNSGKVSGTDHKAHLKGKIIES